MSLPPARNAAPLELLAPAGDWQCVRAAVENGADAIYFGLDCGFNARYRAKNFGVNDLPDLTQLLRQRNVRGYVTLNTLVFPSELPSLIPVVEAIASSGIDAVLVQDFGVARVVREICPELEIHASTQMSLTSAETVAVASRLGLSRVVLARELSVKEIGKIAAETDMPLEVFIHGALCVAYSGQCLTSESLGGRSANRGQCAQACRLPYELICDDEDRDLGDVRFLLSPQDLAGYAAIPDLIDAGIASIKIEGRLKTPEYVANITAHYRKAIDEAYRSGTVTVTDEDQREMELSFSRGFTPGWLEGNDHKRLVPGLQSAKRGIELGSVIEADRGRIRVWLDAPVALGDGIAISGIHGQEDQGGRVYSLTDETGGSHKSLDSGQIAWIGFGRGEIDWGAVSLDATVFKNDDPKLNRRLRRSYAGEDPHQRQPLDIEVFARTGQPPRIVGRISNQIEAEVTDPDPLPEAKKHAITEQVISEKIGRLGGTPFQLRQLRCHIEDAPMMPMAVLNRLRRELVDKLLERLESARPRSVQTASARKLIDHHEVTVDPIKPQLTVLCRNLEQVEALCESSEAIDVLYADFHDVRQYRDAVRIAREAGQTIGLATVRMQKPGEMGLLRAIRKHAPDLVLARNLAAIEFFRAEGITTVADFSLNIANHVAAEWVLSQGPIRVTASYDLNRDQLLDLVGSLPGDKSEVVIHQHMPMFHMEHCVFCSVLSPGTNKTNCGRPCDHHVVKLRDRVGAEHLLEADIACRNTLYNESPQSGAELVGELTDRVGRFRIELLEEDADSARSVVAIYRRLIAGTITGQEVWQTLQATNRVGVTRGTLESKRNPLAIL